MRTIAATTFILAALFSTAALAQSARPSDGQVEKLIEQTQKAEADFDRALDGKLKQAIVRGPSGEVMVSIFLADFKTDIARMKERFSPKYAASAAESTTNEAMRHGVNTAAARPTTGRFP